MMLAMNDHLTIFVSFIVFGLINNVLLPTFGLLAAYKNLDKDKKLQWDSRTTSTIHAIPTTVVAFIVVFIRTKEQNDLTWLNDPLSTWNVAFSCGYFMADIISMSIYRKKVGGSPGFMAHHVVSVLAYNLCITQGYLSYYANFRILSEASTPFLNFRWKLHLVDKSDSSLYFWNGILLVATYFACRIIPIPFFWRSVYHLITTPNYIAGVGPAAHYSWLGGCFVLDVLNIYWFYLLASKAMTIIKKKEN